MGYPETPFSQKAGVGKDRRNEYVRHATTAIASNLLLAERSDFAELGTLGVRSPITTGLTNAYSQNYDSKADLPGRRGLATT